ncbi:hypothetical protein Mmol_1381 [Methylotenera mobilis JLW8]|uniref:Uncharacterized protein n=1 Tax=Methylotenera mobilis (strain JLW8 / ATCC BAA-1282 / DSM 17540) TaxID=583345 RepID=C6WWI8_METML|nr:hypothetical protein Mmol_1381 [Methylotenera mobilis JLW8]
MSYVVHQRIGKRCSLVVCGFTATNNTLRRVEQRKPHEACYFVAGGQEGQAVIGRKPRKDLVTTNQHSLNGECWALGARSFKGTSNDRVCVFGENQHKATNQALQSFGSVVSTVATHLTIVWRGLFLAPSVVLFKVAMHNPSINMDWLKPASYFKR